MKRIATYTITLVYGNEGLIDRERIEADVNLMVSNDRILWEHCPGFAILERIDVEPERGVPVIHEPPPKTDRDPAERIQELLEANTRLAERNQALSVELKHAQRDADYYRKWWHRAADTQGRPTLQEHVSSSERQRRADDVLKSHGIKPSRVRKGEPEMIDDEAMFTFVTNTGSVYEDCKRRAREGHTLKSWFNFISKQALPLYRRQFGPTTIRYEHTFKAAERLKQHYDEHIAQL